MKKYPKKCDKIFYYLIWPICDLKRCSILLDTSSTRRLHSSFGILYHPSITISLWLFKLWGLLIRTLSLREVHKFLIRLRLGFSDGQSNMSKHFFSNQTWLEFYVCLGSLSCWKMKSSLSSISEYEAKIFFLEFLSTWGSPYYLWWFEFYR